MKTLIGNCTGKGKYVSCGSENIPIANKSTMQCVWCNEKRKKQAKIAKGWKPKIYRKKPTGEYAIFLAKAAVGKNKNGMHTCAITKTEVNVYRPDGTLNVSCFMHVVSKGAYPGMRLWDINIAIVHPWVHRIYDTGNATERAHMEKNYPETWNKLKEHKDLLISEWNNGRREI